LKERGRVEKSDEILSFFLQIFNFIGCDESFDRLALVLVAFVILALVLVAFVIMALVLVALVLVALVLVAFVIMALVLVAFAIMAFVLKACTRGICSVNLTQTSESK
jgi:hypothetical protein